MSTPPAVIAGATQTGVLGMRSLASHGIDVGCIDADPRVEGFRSVHGRADLCPNPDTSPEEWLTFMIDLAAATGRKPVLISSADQFVTAIATHRMSLADHYLLSPGAGLQGLLADKSTQYELALQHGMPLPRTRLVTSVEDVQEFAAEAEFPCLIKPLTCREWGSFPTNHALSHRKVDLSTSPDELIESWRLAAEVNPAAIVQEIIQGPDTNKRVYVACYDRDGRRIGSAMFRELRCYPVGFGPASVSEPVIDPAADELCDHFLQDLNYSGICEIEMKRDARDGELKLIEANPRMSGGGDAAPHAGVDVCWLHYRDMIGEMVDPILPSRHNFRHVVVRADARAVVANRAARMVTRRDALKALKPPLAFFDLDRRDWRYSLRTMILAARYVGGEIRNTIRHRHSRFRAAEYLGLAGSSVRPGEPSFGGSPESIRSQMRLPLLRARSRRRRRADP